MKQTRLYMSASQAECTLALDLLSARFEDDGYPIATMEIDEANDIWEASVYISQDEHAEMLEAVTQCLTQSFNNPVIKTEILPDIDWVSHSLEGLQPVRAGRFLVHGSHDREQIRANDLSIEIDAGRAFGTGHHGTTAGCLEMIERVTRRNSCQNALDLGTGSGVLALGIAMLTQARVLATDIDPVAIDVARDNVRINRCGNRIKLQTAAGFHSDVFIKSGPFDLIVANILARPLMGMAPAISRNLTADGQLILSGILAQQRMKVLAAFNTQGLYHRETLWRDGWVTLLLS